MNKPTEEELEDEEFENAIKISNARKSEVFQN